MTEDNTRVVDGNLAAEPAVELSSGQPEQSQKGHRSAPWKGRKRVDDPRDKVLRIRCSSAELERMETRATESGLSLGAFLRTAGMGQGGPRAVKRPRVEKELLARLLGEVGKVGSNVNQIAKRYNASGDRPSLPELDEVKADIAALRAALMGALGRDQ